MTCPVLCEDKVQTVQRAGDSADASYGGTYGEMQVLFKSGT